jgi:hypothetical protein
MICISDVIRYLINKTLQTRKSILADLNFSAPKSLLLAADLLWKFKTLKYWLQNE